jgi:glycosyltransferase involved in cell wall biosynthesis
MIRSSGLLVHARGGVPDYVDDASGWLLPIGDVSAYVDLIVSLCENRDLARNRRAAARAQALKFDWRIVAEQMTSPYSVAGKL